jgi:hypothetical protein
MIPIGGDGSSVGGRKVVGFAHAFEAGAPIPSQLAEVQASGRFDAIPGRRGKRSGVGLTFR